MVKIPANIRKKLAQIKAKRPKTVIDHLLRFGQISTTELSEKYGYEHPPRAIRDVREYGIPVTTFSIKDKNGKSVAAYKFGDLQAWGGVPRKAAGRVRLTQALKKALMSKFGARCAIYLEEMDPASLQVDHRIPYEIAGEANVKDLDAFMLLCPSANRAKSWTCEHCENWKRKEPAFCLRCFWAHPEQYDHVAGKEIRQIALMFTGKEVEDYEKLINLSGREQAQSTIKEIIHEHLNGV
ncbi:MAG: HNH endonuclease [Kiritimatiellae bacterium]|nr:HNH endonuclease [Kiritimatiellia bacterium]